VGFSTRVSIVTSDTGSGIGSWRRCGLLAVVAYSIVGSGCGSSGTEVVHVVPPGAGKLIKENDPVQPTGKGKNRGKRVDELSRRERTKLLREAGEKLQKQQ